MIHGVNLRHTLQDRANLASRARYYMVSMGRHRGCGPDHTQSIGFDPHDRRLIRQLCERLAIGMQQMRPSNWLHADWLRVDCFRADGLKLDGPGS